MYQIFIFLLAFKYSPHVGLADNELLAITMNGRMLQLLLWAILLTAVYLQHPDTTVNATHGGQVSSDSNRDITPTNEDDTTAVTSYNGGSAVRVSKMMDAKEMALRQQLLTLWACGYGVIGLTAVVGNSLNLVVLLRRKRTISPYTYMTAMAACDLVSGLCIILLYCCRYQPLQRASSHARLMAYYLEMPVSALTEACATSAGLLAMVLGIDRLIAVRFPFKRATWCRVRHARLASTLVIALGAIINLLTVFRLRMVWVWDEAHGFNVSLLIFTTFGNDKYVNMSARSLAIIFRLLVPFASMLITSTVTLRAVYRASRFRRSAAAAAAAATKTSDGATAAVSSQCVAITLGVAMAFFVTQAPRTAYYVDSMIFGNAHFDIFAFYAFMLVVDSIAWCNINVNFFIYAALSQPFRQDVKALFTRSHPNSTDTKTGTNLASEHT